MQIQSLRIKSYRGWCIDEHASEVAIARLKKLELYGELKDQGCSEEIRLKAIACSRSTYYRWSSCYQRKGIRGLEEGDSRPKCVRTPQWTRQQEQAVLHLRCHFKTWGKRKIWKVLVRDQGLQLSESTVGRILSKLIRLGRVKPVAFYYGQVKPKRRRRFKHHAKRWKLGMKAKQVGELIQIDHMSVGFSEGFKVKEFKATCPITGMTFMRGYSCATSRNAKRFLQYLIKQAPFEISSIQVDGGSEFRDEFETACEGFDIPLYVLPPKSPKYNGCVERANGTSRYDFYPFYEGALTIESINHGLDDFQSHYNEYRPHDSLDLATPCEYYQNLVKAARMSHRY